MFQRSGRCRPQPRGLPRSPRAASRRAGSLRPAGSRRRASSRRPRRRSPLTVTHRSRWVANELCRHITKSTPGRAATGSEIVPALRSLLQRQSSAAAGRNLCHRGNAGRTLDARKRLVSVDRFNRRMAEPRGQPSTRSRAQALSRAADRAARRARARLAEDLERALADSGMTQSALAAAAAVSP